MVLKTYDQKYINNILNENKGFKRIIIIRYLITIYNPYFFYDMRFGIPKQKRKCLIQIIRNALALSKQTLH